MAVAVDLVAVDVIPGERFQLRVKLRRPLLLLRIRNRVGVDQIQLESSFEDRTREAAPFPVLLTSVLGDLSGFESLPLLRRTKFFLSSAMVVNLIRGRYAWLRRACYASSRKNSKISAPRASASASPTSMSFWR